jgi:hypothetical protein
VRCASQGHWLPLYRGAVDHCHHRQGRALARQWKIDTDPLPERVGRKQGGDGPFRRTVLLHRGRDLLCRCAPPVFSNMEDLKITHAIIVVVAARVCTRLGAGLPRVLALPGCAARLDADAMREQAVAFAAFLHGQHAN